MCRGTYRASPAKWFIPEAIELPADSFKDPSSGGIISKPRKAGDGLWELVVDVPTKLAPLTLAFQLLGEGSPELGRGGHKFAVPVGMAAGHIEPLGKHSISQSVFTESAAPWLVLRHTMTSRFHAGASLASSYGQTSSVNFVVRSRGAYSMALVLARKQPQGSNKPSGCLEIALDPVVNKTGDLWHICVQVSWDVLFN